MLTEIQHVASVGIPTGKTESGDKDNYSNHFTCIPADIAFRPARLTPKPFVQGPQTAKIVGKSRTKIRQMTKTPAEMARRSGSTNWAASWCLLWDREKATSCWVRVSQDWAGKGWGMINIPRVGQEVIVSFLEGDPDRPIITGRVYNDVQIVPYTLPDDGNANDLPDLIFDRRGNSPLQRARFEDKTGSEQVFVRGEKDYDTRILNDSREWIGNNRSKMVVNRLEKVSGDDYTQDCGQSARKSADRGYPDRRQTDRKGQRRELIQIGGNRTEKVASDQNLGIGSNLNLGGDDFHSGGSETCTRNRANFAHEAGQPRFT